MYFSRVLEAGSRSRCQHGYVSDGLLSGLRSVPSAVSSHGGRGKVSLIPSTKAEPKHLLEEGTTF